jgi:hypothetical protein
LKPTDEEVAAQMEKELQEVAELYPERASEYRAFYMSADGRNSLVDTVANDKVLDFLLSKAELVEEVKLPEAVVTQE